MLVMVFFEITMLLTQVIRVYERPKDKSRLRYLFLLVLLVLYNLCQLFLPQQYIPVSTLLQPAITSTVVFLIIIYFGYFFYKAFNLHGLHSFIPNTVLLSMPFLSLFVLPDLESNVRLNLIPLLFSIAVIYSTAYQLFLRLNQPTSKNKKEENLAVIIYAYVALLVWALAPIISMLGDFKMESLAFSNLGFIVLTQAYTYYSIKEVRAKYLEPFDKNKIEANYSKFNLTKKQIEIVDLIISGRQNGEIADSLFISKHTVSKHIYNIFQKVNAVNKADLINKLNQ